MKRLVLLLLVLAVASEVRGDGQCKHKRGLAPRPHSVSILEFGAAGDGVTLNTLAFQNAIFYLRSFADKGGAQLFVPKGRWLTGSFNLTSHLTLFLEKDAVILGSQDSSQWPIIDPLPSYGRGIELPGGRHRSLINGYNLTDVVITGDNGTIDGQGSIWWQWFNSHSLNYSRPHLVELVSSNNVVISNLTLLNSPAWSIHPVYCNNVEVLNITIHAPSDSPFTDGIVPDSCSQLCIEDCTISAGHDAISLKSGWDEYGISFGQPSSDIHITKISLQSPLGSALAFGSEMSGGISDIQVEHLHIQDSKTGIIFKTTQGRGGYIKNILISDVQMENIELAFKLMGNYSSHPDEKYDPTALPVISGITFKNIIGSNVSTAGVFSGIKTDKFSAICLSNITLSVHSDPSWMCSDVSGFSDLVSPHPCAELQSDSSVNCYSLITYNLLASA
ncbi:uncharacterized protein A4U43_C02F21570 [Asparagus officinalis]|uniref:Pectate lyase superfamily protein domain-containing protein n=1 Tax=Asparagus officinalis TaxID=4686 RepID=A0A5P1FKU3_ASPOF|nr:probable polygalacturonase [Asparagus officinalis]ONK78704.1 uncharacterized protein A4U43_C02F21570 [Asparagus officinalis]